MLLKTEDSQHELANQRTSDDKIYNPTPLKSNHHTVDIIRSIQNTKIEDNKANKSNSLPPSVGVAVPVDLDRRSPEISQEQLFEQAEWHTFINLDKAKLQLQQQHYRTNSDLSPFSSFFPFNQRYNCHNQIDSNAGNEMNQTAISLQNITKIDAPVIKCGTQIKEEVVPRSMEEIYQLSNQNRKRNKEKKKLKEDSIIQASTSVQPVDDTEFRDENEGKCDAAAPEDTQEFMKKIGWISDYNFDSTSPASYDPNHNKHRRTKSSPINNNNNSNSNNNNNSNHNHSAPTNKDDPLNPHSQYKDTPKHKRYSKHQNKTFPMTNNKHNHNYHHHQNHYHSNYFFDNNQNNQNNNNNNNNNNGNSNNSNYNKSSNDTKFVNNSEERSYSYSSRTSSYSQPRGSSGNNSPTSNRSRPKGARGNQVFVAKSVQKTVPQKY